MMVSSLLWNLTVDVGGGGGGVRSFDGDDDDSWEDVGRYWLSRLPWACFLEEEEVDVEDDVWDVGRTAAVVAPALDLTAAGPWE